MLVTLRRTCTACPSQWEGQLDDGRALYARYRHGHLYVGIADTISSAVRDEQPLIDQEIGDAMDGMMTDQQLQSHLRAAGIDLAEGLVADPCTADHSDLGWFGCEVCGEQPSAKDIERMSAALAQLGQRLRRRQTA
jgi:hypothetical protein